MRFLIFLPVQALFVALLYSYTFAEVNVPTLDGVFKLVGSLYQKKLYSITNDVEAESLRNQIVQDSFSGVFDNVTFPIQEICLVAMPFCLTLYTTITVRKIRGIASEDKGKFIRNDDYDDDSFLKSCISDIVLDSCPKDVGIGDEDPVFDISNLHINDFCLSEALGLSGTLKILEDITEETSIYVEVNREQKLSDKQGQEDAESPTCINGGDCQFFNVCNLIEEEGCVKQRSFFNNMNFPCTCPVGKGTYDMNSFKKLVPHMDGFGYGKVNGFAIVTSGGAKTCFSFSFTRTLEKN